jgi:hypothetical protein
VKANRPDEARRNVSRRTRNSTSLLFNAPEPCDVPLDRFGCRPAAFRRSSGKAIRATCYERSLAVMNYLERKGIDRRRFRLRQAGPYELQATPQNPLWCKRNSRDELAQ